MAIIFDGKIYSLKKKELLRAGANLLREKGIIPHLATILIGEDRASSLYVNLKKKFIEEIGCQLDIYKLSTKVSFEDIELLVNTLNEDNTVHGIMVQFPLPIGIKSEELRIKNLISEDKDVDGLLDKSKFVHPTAKAVLEIIKIAENENKHSLTSLKQSLASFAGKIEVKTICVVGASGMVGKPLVKQLSVLGYKVISADKDTADLTSKTLISDCIVSVTGVMNLITPDMVKNDSVLIDVGSPVGDISPLCEEKASFVTPVPGGVGPVTITCLAENLLQAAMENDI